MTTTGSETDARVADIHARLADAFVKDVSAAELDRVLQSATEENS